MVQTRKERKVAESSAGIKLAHPDRSGPTEKTLIDWAQERQLFDQADSRQRALPKTAGKLPANAVKVKVAEGEATEQPTTGERVLEALLWSFSLCMLHFTLDVLVQKQFASEFVWAVVVTRTLRAFVGTSLPFPPRGPCAGTQLLLLTLGVPPSPVFAPLFYVLHPHGSNPTLVPGLPAHWQHPLRQFVFFVTSVCAGCYLIYISNTYSYLAVMKQSPPVGCLWIWSVMELDLLPAVTSVACAGTYLRWNGYGYR